MKKTIITFLLLVPILSKSQIIEKIHSMYSKNLDTLFVTNDGKGMTIVDHWLQTSICKLSVKKIKAGDTTVNLTTWEVKNDSSSLKHIVVVDAICPIYKKDN